MSLKLLNLDLPSFCYMSLHLTVPACLPSFLNVNVLCNVFFCSYARSALKIILSLSLSLSLSLPPPSLPLSLSLSLSPLSLSLPPSLSLSLSLSLARTLASCLSVSLSLSLSFTRSHARKLPHPHADFLTRSFSRGAIKYIGRKKRNLLVSLLVGVHTDRHSDTIRV